MKIDSHQHFWRYDAARDAWITDSMAVLKHDFLPEHLAGELAANGIDASIAVQADQSENETKVLLDLAEKNSRIAGVVGWADLLSSRVDARLEYFSHFPKLRGFRHIAQTEPDDRFLMRKEFVNGIAQLAAFGFTYDILICPRQLTAAIELVGRFPQQQFVIDHCAKPEIKFAKTEPWATQVKEIAQNKTVFCKVSGLITEADWKHWKADDFKPYLDVVFGAFGAERVMFGSDWPVCLLACDYGKWFATAQHLASQLSANEQDQLFGGVAAKVYSLQVSRDVASLHQQR